MKSSQESLLVRTLSAWFAGAARDLPWRRPKMRTGYGALVAEAMLQQTQVARVVERYPAFMRRFPNVRALAAASEQDVLEHWQGMGYYRRARHLHQAAQLVVRDFRGRVPSDVDALQQLPGVGRYTAGAIASIVFGAAQPIVDGNVERVLARIYCKRHRNSEAKAWTWETAERLVKLAQLPVNGNRPGAVAGLLAGSVPGAGVFNEALMELGATVCTPRGPRCDECPLKSMCAAKKAGAQHEIPLAKVRAKPLACVHHAVVISRAQKVGVLLEQRSANGPGMWAGMWQVPTIEREHAMSAAKLRSALPFAVTHLAHTGSFEHSTTHRAITFHIYTARTKIRRGKWLAPDSTELARLPMSAAQRRVLELTSASR